MNRWNMPNGHRIARLTLMEPLWILFLGIPVLLPGEIISPRHYPFALLGLFLFWPLRWYATGRLSRRSPLDWSVALLLLWLPVTLWASADRTTSWIAAGYYLFGLSLYMALINWPPAQRKPQRAAWFLLLVGSSLAIASPPLTAWKPQFRLFDLPLYDRLQALPIELGETIHANILAGALVIVLPLILSLAIQRNGSQTEAQNQGWNGYAVKIFFGALALVVGGVIVLTQSRGGYLALAVALTLVLLLRWPRLLNAIPVLIILVLLVVNRVGLEGVLNQLSADGTLGGWSGRIEIWEQSFNALNDFVFTGIGIGTFSIVLPLLYPLRVSIESYPHAHNIFLQIGLDLGLPGLVAYLAMFVNLFVMLVSSMKAFRAASQSSLQPNDSNSRYWAMAAGAMGGLVAMIVHGLLDVVVWGTKLAFVSWVLFALIVLLFCQEQQVRRQEMGWIQDHRE